MKKIVITILTLITVMISMTVSVFAWFYDGGAKAEVNGVGGTVVEPNIYFEFDTDYDTLIDTTRFEDLVYVTNADLAKGTVTDFGGLSTNIAITVKNPKKDKFKIYAGVDIAASLESGPYNGIDNALLYLVYSEADVAKAVAAGKDVVQYVMETEIYNFDRSNLNEEAYVAQIIRNLKMRNGVRILGENTQETMFIAAWGYYDGLKGNTYNGISLHDVYYSLVYRVTFMLRGGLL